MRLGFDFDGVYADSHPLKPKIAKQMFGVDIPPERFERKWVVPGLLTKEQYEAVGREVFFGSHPVPLVKDADLYTDLLIKDRHTTEIITSRSDESLAIAKQLLQEYRIDMSIVGVGYGVSKLPACQDLDVYVDDDIPKLIPMIGIVRNLLLFSWPQNEKEEVPKGIVRVANWWEVYNYIRYEI